MEVWIRSWEQGVAVWTSRVWGSGLDHGDRVWGCGLVEYMR